jgi:omega-hydroxy-beta-dihydromenaquinone-9 sulfotransferase
MSWRETFAARLSTGMLSGVTTRTWLRILDDNGYAVDRPYWPRAALCSLNALGNSLRRRLEDLRFRRAVMAYQMPPPVFVLGIWRSGTTHLHNLLSRDPRFAAPTLYQVCYPTTFLSSERMGARVLDFFVPRKRPMDNVKMASTEPQEDEWALCSLTGRCAMMHLFFPRTEGLYDRYLTLRGLPPDELNEWTANLDYFIRKVAYRNPGKPVVLKSPAHTGRIRTLLRMYPDARFVHIHRNPYDVFASCRFTFQKVAEWCALQHPRFPDMDEELLGQFKEIFDAFFEDVPLIPKGRFHEFPYDALTADPIGTLRRMYGSLGLRDFAEAEPAISQYLATLKDYQKNRFAPLPAELKHRIAATLPRCFDEWGYSPAT